MATRLLLLPCRTKKLLATRIDGNFEMSSSYRSIVKIIFGIIAVVTAVVLFFLRPVTSAAKPMSFIVSGGQGFGDIAGALARDHLVRSAFFTRFYMVFSGSANQLKPGNYMLSPASSTQAIVGAIAEGMRHEIEVTIPEGYSLYDIDNLLAEQGIVVRGSIIAEEKKATSSLEGKLFPDTYRFFPGSSAREVIEKFLQTFDLKAGPLLAEDPARTHEVLVIASLLESEVPLYEDRRIVAGIILKRLKAGMPLQLDATVCYIKKMTQKGVGSCTPLTPLDFRVDSPYNTYVYKGLPPGPIANPGLDAIKAALHPTSSPYWFYLSDPVTKKTIFAQTLDKHTENRIKYLGSH